MCYFEQQMEGGHKNPKVYVIIHAIFFRMEKNKLLNYEHWRWNILHSKVIATERKKGRAKLS